MPWLIFLVIAVAVVSSASTSKASYVPPVRRKSRWERIVDRIRDFFTPPTRLDISTLSALEKLVLARHTGGTMRRRSGRRLTLTDYRRAMEAAASDERRLGELCDALRLLALEGRGPPSAGRPQPQGEPGMTRDTKPGTSLPPSSLELEPALDGEILPPGQKLPRPAPLSPKRFGRGLDYRRQAREEDLKADSEHAFGYYIDAVNERVKKQQNLTRTLMGCALVKEAHELDRLEARDTYNRRLEEIADRQAARDERERRAELARKRDTLELAVIAAKTDRKIAECLRDIARFEQRHVPLPPTPALAWIGWSANSGAPGRLHGSDRAAARRGGRRLPG